MPPVRAKLKADDPYRVGRLNLRSMDLLPDERSEVPCLRVLEDGMTLSMGLEKVRRAAKLVSSSPHAIVFAGDGGIGLVNGLPGGSAGGPVNGPQFARLTASPTYIGLVQRNRQSTSEMPVPMSYIV